MPDLENFTKLLQIVFGNIPSWVLPVVGSVMLVYLLLLGLQKAKEAWSNTLQPLFYQPEQQRRRHQRRKFAEHIEYEIRRIDRQEDWRDDRFAELEAEVEAEGLRQRTRPFPFGSQRNGLRRERSLSRAITSSRERFILIEGEPGCGKSVALRHVAQQFASKAKKARSLHSVIPIYVNLKELERTPAEIIDRNLIEAFVLKTLRRSNDRDIDRFLDEEFAKGREQGTWFFLFDSFDELPEVLSSTEADTIIRQYSDAINDFLAGGMSRCRGVIASRQFRGPKQFGWPRFRILALTEERRRQLIRKVHLPIKLEQRLIGSLATARDEIRSWASNPLFLALLCEHVRGGNPFPENIHTVFETYIEDRLKRDQGRIQQRYAIDTTDLRTAAENIAFCMVADHGLGLSPTRLNLPEAMLRQGMKVPANFEVLLDALEYIKLARADTVAAIASERTFTFAHRRFQEYFATCVVLRDPLRIPPKQLLSDGRWRETAVVMCQTQPVQVLQPLFEQAVFLLKQMCNQIPNLIRRPISYTRQVSPLSRLHPVAHFPWPPKSLYLVELLQDGLAGRLDEIPKSIRRMIGRIGLSATETGTLGDRKWALEVCGIAPEPVFSYMLQNAFLEQSQWLKEVAYRQAARVQSIHPEIEKGMRLAILKLATEKRLQRERYSTQTHLARLPHATADRLLSITSLLLYLPYICLGWCIILLLCFAFWLRSSPYYVIKMLIAIVSTPFAYVSLTMIRRKPTSIESSALMMVILFSLGVIFCLFLTPDSLSVFYGQIFLGRNLAPSPSWPLTIDGATIFVMIVLYIQILTVGISARRGIASIRKANWSCYAAVPFFPSMVLLVLQLRLFFKLFASLRSLNVTYLLKYRAHLAKLILQRLVQAYHKLVKFVQGYSLNALLLDISFLVGGISLLSIVTFILVFYTKNPVGPSIVLSFFIIVLIYFGIFHAYRLIASVIKNDYIKMATDLTNELVQYVEKKLYWHRLRKHTFTYRELFAAINASKEFYEILIMIIYTRRHHLLLPSDEAKIALRNYAFKIEQLHPAYDQTSTTCALLDELYLLIEDLRSQQENDSEGDKTMIK